MNILVVAGSYPTAKHPTAGAFVREFVWALARNGNTCTVVNPASVLDLRDGGLPDRRRTERAGDGATVEVLRPRYVSFSVRDLVLFNTAALTLRSFRRAAVRSVMGLMELPDLVYGHFLYFAGQTAVEIGRMFGIPAVVGVGEGTFWTVTPFGFRRARRQLKGAAGYLAVASHIRDGLIEQLHVPPARVSVEPNGVDLRLFQPIDRGDARAQLSLPARRFLIVFVGAFDELKGGAELVAAVEGMAGVGLVMLGHGSKRFVSRHILHQGSVPHNDIPVWLSAGDIFVLPTREEGSCNAVIEALACGLPVITAKGQYMDDIVDDDVALRVDPTNVGEIRDAILKLKDNPELVRRMSAKCLERARAFDIDARAGRVSEWMARQVARRNKSGPPCKKWHRRGGTV